MGKLKTLPPRVQRLPPSIGAAPNTEAARTNPLRPLYFTTRWQRLRASVLLRDLYTCQRCGRVQATHMVADHKTPHRGDLALFWDIENIETLCPSCHSSAKQREEQAMLKGKWD